MFSRKKSPRYSKLKQTLLDTAYDHENGELISPTIKDNISLPRSYTFAGNASNYLHILCNKQTLYFIIAFSVICTLLLLTSPHWKIVPISVQQQIDNNSNIFHSNAHSFSNSIKSGYILANKETLLFETFGKSGVITEQWTGGGTFHSSPTNISIYVDGELIPSIKYDLLLAHGIGFGSLNEEKMIKKHGAWSTQYISHASARGGLSNRFLIPFKNSVRVTATTAGEGKYWYWVHGMYNFPIIYSSRFHIPLPSNTRLKLYKNVNVSMKNLEFLTLVNVSETAGALFMFSVAVVHSTSNAYMEGCFRIRIDSSKENDFQFLSSGFEDIFLGSYYFDGGVFFSDEVSLVSRDDPMNGEISAFRFFDSDPMLFRKSLEVVWRCGEHKGIDKLNGCPNTFYNGNIAESIDKNNKYTAKKANNTIVTTYTWVYEYTF